MDTDYDGLLFVNLVDFDMLYGHRNNPSGYAEALEYFDKYLPYMIEKLGEEDLLIAAQLTTDVIRRHREQIIRENIFLFWCMVKSLEKE